jgi:hypothetical protein
MKNIALILAEALVGWDEKHVSALSLDVIKTLAPEARFDDITVLMQSLIEHHKRSDLNYALNHIPGVLLNQYVYGNTAASQTIVDEYWRSEGAGAAITDAVLKDGQLAAVMAKIMRDLQEMADPLP